MTDRFPGVSQPTLPVSHTRTCTVRIYPGLRFDLVAGADELSGQTSFGVDPLARHCFDRGRLPGDSLVYLALALVEPGDTVLDIGAHIGTFSLALASAGCRVVAVEASPRNAALLDASVARNGLSDRLHVVNVAASDHPGSVPFVLRGPYGHVTRPGAPDTIEVPAVPIPQLLRDLGIDRVDLIKLDVEGHEAEVLHGMAPWLAEQEGAPILYEANHFCHLYRGWRTAHALKEVLRGLGFGWQYRIDAAARRLTPVLAGDFQGQMTTDYLAAHELITMPAGWRLGRPAGTGDHVRAILTTALRHPEPAMLACLARVLGEAPLGVLGHPAVVNLVSVLMDHPDAAVRQAAGELASRPLDLKGRTTAWAWLAWARARLTLERHFIHPLQSLSRRLAG